MFTVMIVRNFDRQNMFTMYVVYCGVKHILDILKLSVNNYDLSKVLSTKTFSIFVTKNARMRAG